MLFRPTKSYPDVQLWREWLTHAAAVARLHLDYGYPKNNVSLDEDSFDVVVHGRHNEPFIAVEVKKTMRELDKMIERLLELSRGEGGLPALLQDRLLHPLDDPVGLGSAGVDERVPGPEASHGLLELGGAEPARVVRHHLLERPTP